MEEIPVAQFFKSDGTLTHIPAKANKKIAVLRQIAFEFESGVKYPEKEVNEIISRFHPDTAAIRRHMIEYKILVRDSASVYWLA
jgi:hypothetical protein